MTYLSSNQLKQYEDEGFVSPINIFSKDKAKEIRNEIELIEKEMPGELDKSGRYNAHLISPLLDEVTHNPKILDAVQSLIGENILVCGTTLFIKNPNEKGFVSYHQDAKYIGLEPHNWVTAWVAITDSNERNGCMRMWSGSHKDNLKQHNQKFNEGKATWIFEPIEVIVGLKNDRFAEVRTLMEFKKGQLFAQNSAYILMAELKKEEAEHSH